MRVSKLMGLAVLLSATSACTTMSLKELRRAEPAGDAFSAALSQEYLVYSEEQATAYDWIDSQYFAQKGLRAAYGKEVLPEDPADWRLKKDVRHDLSDAREALMMMLTPEVKRAYPQLAARAQYAFDGWIENQEEEWQKDVIAQYKTLFLTTLAELEKKTSGKKSQKHSAEPAKGEPTAAAPVILKREEPVAEVTPEGAEHFAKPEQPAETEHEIVFEKKQEAAPAKTGKMKVAAAATKAAAPKVPAPAPAPAEEKSVMPVADAAEPEEEAAPAPEEEKAPAAPRPEPLFTTTSYVIYFDGANDALTPAGGKVVDTVVNDLKKLQTYEIIINGHTDRKGDAEKNLEVSQQRAEMVRDALVSRGVNKDQITVFAFGESDPRVPTADGVAEPANRRVEIFISN